MVLQGHEAEQSEDSLSASEDTVRDVECTDNPLQLSEMIKIAADIKKHFLISHHRH